MQYNAMLTTEGLIMVFKIIDPFIGGGTVEPPPPPVTIPEPPPPFQHTFSTPYFFDESRDHFSSANIIPSDYSRSVIISKSGGVPIYNEAGVYSHDNEYGYTTNLVTNDFKNNAGQLKASAGPLTLQFSSIFALSPEQDTIRWNAPAWQTIHLSDFTIYIEDSSGNKLDLNYFNESVGVGAQANSFIETIPEDQRQDFNQEASKELGNALMTKIPVVGDIIEAVGILSKLGKLASTTNLDELFCVERYMKDLKEVHADFCWGKVSEYDQMNPIRQQLAFKIYLSFYAPPTPGSYKIVFKQNVYLRHPILGDITPVDKEYKYSLRATSGYCAMRTFEVKYPISLV